MAVKTHGKTVQEAINIQTFIDPTEMKSYVTDATKQVGIWGLAEEWHSLRCIARSATISSGSAWPWGLSTALGGVPAQSPDPDNPFTTTAARLNMTAFDPATAPAVLTIDAAGAAGMNGIADFPDSGTLYLVSYESDVAYRHYITYTGTGINTFTGCTGWNLDAAGEDIDDDTVVSLYKNADGSWPMAAPTHIKIFQTTTSSSYGIAVKANNPLGANVFWKLATTSNPMEFTPSIRVDDIFFAATSSTGADTSGGTTLRGLTFQLFF